MIYDSLLCGSLLDLLLYLVEASSHKNNDIESIFFVVQLFDSAHCLMNRNELRANGVRKEKKIANETEESKNPADVC